MKGLSFFASKNSKMVLKGSGKGGVQVLSYLFKNIACMSSVFHLFDGRMKWVPLRSSSWPIWHAFSRETQATQSPRTPGQPTGPLCCDMHQERTKKYGISFLISMYIQLSSL